GHRARRPTRAPRRARPALGGRAALQERGDRGDRPRRGSTGPPSQRRCLARQQDRSLRRAAQPRRYRAEWLVHASDDRKARRRAARGFRLPGDHLGSVRLKDGTRMQLRENAFKDALRASRPQIGLWVGLADAYVTELLATAGFDWLALDAEHAPNDPRSILAQLQAMAPYPVHAVVRTASGDATLIKQYLDIGAQTLLIPMVESAEQAQRVVAATRYPPAGIRGVGSALARAARWNQIADYLHRCAQEICVLVQVESAAGLGNLQAIASTEGVDGVFFGPADLAASMGLLGRTADQRVQDAIAQGIRTVRGAAKAAGVLSTDPTVARKYLALGALFVAVGVDTTLLVRAANDLRDAFKDAAGVSQPSVPDK